MSDEETEVEETEEGGGGGVWETAGLDPEEGHMSYAEEEAAAEGGEEASEE